MKRILICFLFAAFPAAAQWRHFGTEPIAPEGFFGIGFSAPVNPLASKLDAGWNAAGGIGLSSQYVGITLDAMYTDFGINHATLARAGVTRGSQKYWALTVDPIFHVNRRGPVDFYVTAGAGLYGQITQYRLPSGFVGPFGGNSDLLSSNTIYKGGVDGGAGFSFSVWYHPNVKIFAEARFHHMFTAGPGASFIPVTVGLRF
jgi:hypothetical protein